MDFIYDIIRLQNDGTKYCQRFSDEYYREFVERWKHVMKDITVDSLRRQHAEQFQDYTEKDIPIGASRIGGPVVDMPDDLSYPEGYFFLAQINCSQAKEYDICGLLPHKGFLYFFSRNPGLDGVVMYSPKGAEELKRIIREHDDWFFFGSVITNIRTEKESLESRYMFMDGIRQWDYFAGTSASKIYGIYTNCQAEEQEVIERLKDENNVLLLQVGSDFLDQGTLCVSIDREDLVNCDFSRCRFEYNQS